jgi:hypothetical protein
MNSLIWGILLVLIGMELIFKAIFGINIPIFRIAFGLFLIYLGTTFLTDSNKSTHHAHKKGIIRFEKKIINETDIKHNYQVIFGEAFINLADADITKPTHVTVSTQFGSTTLVLNENVPTRITTHASFGNAELPDSTQLTFGSHSFTLGDPEERSQLEIDAHVTFGNLIIKKR